MVAYPKASSWKSSAPSSALSCPRAAANPSAQKMQLPTIAAVSSDSESDDACDLEVFQVPQTLRNTAKPDVPLCEYMQGACAVSAEGQLNTLDKAGVSHVTDVQLVDETTTGYRPEAAEDALLVAADSTSGSCQPYRQHADEQLSAGNSSQSALPNVLSSSSASSSSSHIHIHTVALRGSQSSRSGSSTDSSSYRSSRDDCDIPALSASTSTAAAPGGANSSALLSMDCLLADSDLDALLKRLTVAAAASGSAACDGSQAAGKPKLSAVCRGYVADSSSKPSSDNSTSSLHSPEDTSPPPAASSFSAYEPRWLRQQQQQHGDPQQPSAVPTGSNPASPSKSTPCGKRLWVPSVVVDLRSASAACRACNLPGAGVEVEEQATASAGAGPVASNGRACIASGSESDDSSEEEWQQFRHRHAGAHPYATA